MYLLMSKKTEMGRSLHKKYK